VSGPGARRRLLLDRSAGEARGVVLLDGRPERLLLAREGEPPAMEPGDAAVGRIRRMERALGAAFVDLGGGPDGVLALSGAAARLSEGQAVAVEVAAPARRGKGPALRLTGAGEGAPRRLTPARDIRERLQAFAPEETIVEGPAARDAADAAEEAALAVEHPLGGGASLAVEPTRGIVALDVDVGGFGGGFGSGDARRTRARVNAAAIAEGARLLRLKGLGGLAVFDLAGGAQDGEAVLAAARKAFAPDEPGVAYGPVSRLGVFHLALPWRSAPVAERLLDPDGRPSARTVAQRIARAIEREAASCTRVLARCAPDVALAASELRQALVERLGPRIDIAAEPGFAREAFEVRPND